MRWFRRRTRGVAGDDPPHDGHRDDASEIRSDAPGTADSPPGAADAFDALRAREWDRLAAPGTWLTGAERVRIATEARRAMRGGPPEPLPPVIVEAAHRVAVAAATIRPADLERWAAEGLDEWSYVELVGIVGRLSALDVAAFGLGRPAADLPDARRGDPSKIRAEGASTSDGWVPTVGGASAISALSAVPPEHEALFETHGVLYLEFEQMGSNDVVRDGLTRPQMELVAARTSYLNACVY